MLPHTVGARQQLVRMGSHHGKRDHSSDGRIWGLVPLNRVRGKAGFTWIVTEEIPDRIFRFVH